MNNFYPKALNTICLISSFCLLGIGNLFSQTDGVSIDYSGSPVREPKAILQLNSTQQGFILPRMTSTQRVAISPPASAQGLTVYQTDAPKGYYYWDGTQWLSLSVNSGTNYIEDRVVNNTFATGQTADYDITGNAEIGGTLEVGGNVGIGTTTPGAVLDVQSPGYGVPETSGTTQTYAGIRVSPPSSSGNVVLDMGTAGGTNGGWLQTTLRTNLANTYPLSLNPNGGNVGIGVLAPAEKLHVEGEALIDLYDQGDASGLFFRQGFTATNKYNLGILTHDDGDGSPDAMDIAAFDGIYLNTGSNTRNPRLVVDPAGSIHVGPRASNNTNARAILMEKTATAGGEASGRIMFTEHNSTSASADLYGFSIQYSGNAVGSAFPSGATTLLGNAGWGFVGHDNSLDGSLIMSGFRNSPNVQFYGSIDLANGVAVNEFSTDGTMGGNSNAAVPTEAAVVTYVNGQISGADEWTLAGTNLYPNSTTYNVGIGTTSADQKLVVNGIIRATDEFRASTDDWAIRRVGENLQIREPEDADKLWAEFVDDQRLHLSGTPNLWVDGSLRVSGGTPAVGEVLMATNANGDADWVDISAAGIGDNLGNHSATTNLDMNANDIIDVNRVITQATSDYDKLRVYSSSSYTIGMVSAITLGYLNDWAMTFTMNNDADRGFIWRDVSDANSDGAMSLTTDGRLYLKSTAHFNGSVGMGIAAPEDRLHVVGNIRHTGNMVSRGANYTSTWMQFTEDQFGNSLILGAGGLTVVGAGESAGAASANIAAGLETLHLTADGGVEVITNMQGGWGARVNAMTVEPAGDVGIGTTNPTEKLHVSGGTGSVSVLIEADTDNVTESDLPSLVFSQDGGLRTWKLAGTDDNRFEISSPTAAADQHLILNPTGNVGIGLATPTYKLHVNGAIRTLAINETSDQRMKKDITSLSNSLEKVMQMRGVTYNWRKEEFPETDFEDGLQYGMIAQELEKIIPELVETDSEGWKSIEYSHLVPLLIEAIKEQQQIIDQQAFDFKAELDHTNDKLEQLSRIVNDLSSELITEPLETSAAK